MITPTAFTEAIPDEFYQSLYQTSEHIFTGIKIDNRIVERVCQLLDERDPAHGLSVEGTALLLHLVRSSPSPEAKAAVIEAARKIRGNIFGQKVATMVPIEVTSYCASTCKFCGWRADNTDMVRLAITEVAIREQASILANYGFSHFEIAGGDDLNFLRNDLKNLIAALKEETVKVNPDSRVSICLVPMHEQQYALLKEYGLDCVLTWQETYNEDLFNYHIPSGPKAWGIDLDYRITKGGNGFLERLKSQEKAIRAGLQVGMGVMIGLADIAEADILSVIIHGRQLLKHYYGQVQPLIIGMPTWNPITTKNTDNRIAHGFNFDAADNFEMLSAIYLLAFPDQYAWVFSNCRVGLNVQLESIETASCFTSTEVRIAPGGYLNIDDSNPDEKERMFARSTVAQKNLTKEQVLSGEQFTHYYHTHNDFVNQLVSRGLHVVSDQSLLMEMRGKIPSPVGG
ncbi:hypothetical protein OGM63_20935 [Plectonema radiosum NIES-515]|uniref:Radical SAM core domain-containing protein n=1 Tax=Plectonema radiosum NIES-515 TaxID=2986073 RepID=A0ABT3B3I7_9CYAN|nr:radical SAM protein [Plectonema radiosum]MCV3215941.1 hypothetical protein [Plectonema radiosum NIES-515]